MSQTINLTEYYTRKQIQSLLGSGELASPVSAPQVAQVSLAGATQTYIDIAVVPPATPAWASAANKYITGYNILIGGAGKNASCYAVAAGTIRLTPLVAGVNYKIQVAAIDYLGQQGAWSEVLNASTSLNTTPPAQPVITVAPSTVGVLITVTSPNSETDFAGYDLYRDTNANLESEGTLLPAASFRGTSFTDIAYSANGNFYYFLRAKNYSGYHTDSAIVGPIAVVGQPSNAPAPISMAGVTATANADGSISFNFPVSNAPGLTSYHIWRQWAAGMSGWVLLDTVPAGTNSYTDKSCSNGLTYQYSVSVVSSHGESSYDTANAPSATANDTLPPPNPLGGITYTGKTGGISVSWNASADPNTYGYLVHWRYAQTGQNSEFNGGTLVAGTSLLIDGLEDPTTGLPPTRDALANEFEIEVAAVDVNNNISGFVARLDANGNRVPVEFPELNGYQPAGANPPAAPAVGAPICNADGSITIPWTAGGLSTQAGFLVEKLTSGGLAWESLASMTDATAGSKQFTATGLEPYKFRGTQYRFRVRLVDNTGNVSSANLVENSTFLSALTNWAYTTAPAVTANGFNLNPGVKVAASNALTQSIPVVGGQWYALSGYYAKDVSATAKAVLTIQWFNGATQVGAQTQQFAVNQNFQRGIITAPAPANATAAVVSISADVASGATVVWSCLQLEANALATPYGDSKTAWLHAIDTQGPTTYNPQFTVTPDFGCFHLSWVNGTTPDYVNSIYEIWRQRTASSAPGFVADPALVKIVEVAGHDDGKANSWTDNSPDINNHVQAIFAIRARDRFGNAQVNGSGATVYLATSASQQSLDVDDKGVATTGDIGSISTTASNAASSAAQAMALAQSAINKVQVVSAMPSAAAIGQGNFVYLTQVDSSTGTTYQPGLYMSTGTTWTQSQVSASSIVGQIVAGQIAAGAVTAQAIAAGAITATAISLPGITIGGNLNLANSSGNLPLANHAVAVTSTIQPGGGIDFASLLHSNSGLVRNNLIDPSWWAAGAAIPWTQNNGSGTVSNSLVPATMPDGSSRVVWQAQSGAGDGGTGGGGWDGNGNPASNTFPVDTTKTYMFVCFQRTISGGNGQGYWGPPNGSPVCNLNTSTDQGNPYFAVFNKSSMVAGRWYMFIGWVYPAGSTGMSNGQTGVWDCTTGQQVGGGSSFCWNAGVTQCSTRAYQYYATSGVYQFANPGVYVCDGSQPSLQQLLSSAALSGANPITPTNATTYIGAGSISTGLIAAQAITAAQIAAGTITAAQIAAGTITADKIAAASIMLFSGQGQNIIPNGNLALIDPSTGNPSGWGMNGGVYAVDGTYGPRIRMAPGNGGGTQSPNFRVIPGQTYRITFCVWATTGTNTSGGPLRLVWGPTAGSFTNSVDFCGGIAFGTTPTQYTYNWTCPSGMNFAFLVGYTVYGAGNSDMNIQWVSAVPAAALVAYDSSGNDIAEIGPMSGAGPWGGQYGGWFKNIGLGGSGPSSPALYIDNSGNMWGSNGQAIQFNGNLNLKNKLSIFGSTVYPSLSTSWADLPELGSGNSAMTVNCKGNPVMIAVQTAFTSMSPGGATGPVTSIGWSPNSFSIPTSSGAGPPTINISISGDGTGAGAGVGWSGQYQGGTVQFTPQFSIAGGSGYTHATATITISNGSSYNGYTNGTYGPYNCTVSVATPTPNQPFQCRVLMDGATVMGAAQILTDSNGNATWNGTQLLFPAAGNHTFQVQGYAMQSGYPIYSASRGFSLVELG